MTVSAALIDPNLVCPECGETQRNAHARGVHRRR